MLFVPGMNQWMLCLRVDVCCLYQRMKPADVVLEG